MPFKPYNPATAAEAQKISFNIKETQRAIQACVPGSKAHAHYTAQLKIFDASLIEELKRTQSAERKG